MTGGAGAVSDQIEQLFLLLLRQGDDAGEPQPALTRTQRLAVVILATRGPLRLGTLAELMATTNATASRTVDSLERLALAAREADPADARCVLVGATGEARRLVAERRRRLRRAVERGLGEMSVEERERLVALLERLNEALLAAGSPRAETRRAAPPSGPTRHGLARS